MVKVKLSEYQTVASKLGVKKLVYLLKNEYLYNRFKEHHY